MPLATSAPKESYAAVVNWGDGTDPTDGAITGSGGSFEVKGSHTFHSEGVYLVSVTILDRAGHVTTSAGSATVTIAHSARYQARVILPVVPGVRAPTLLPPCPGLRGEPCRAYTPYVNTAVRLGG